MGVVSGCRRELPGVPPTARALSDAEHQLERGRTQTAPAWVSWMSQADLAVDAGRCWLDLNEPRRATAALNEGLGLLAPERERTRAIMLTYRAHTALASRDIDAAVADTRTALETALGTGTSRCLDLVRDTLQKSLEPHQGEVRVPPTLSMGAATYSGSSSSRRRPLPAAT
ncbi:hypothetical protein [Streptomyces sp. 2112.3]|uniref:hypothetical protein n=1 Tax=Streptomyces sp. 2112.3 TaxID=1881023 RepID=UPI000E73B460|nr:hypothetical protein [Streptomyces sp. 2112.3]